MLRLRAPQLAAPFDVKRVRLLGILISRDRRQKIARVGKTVGADRSAVRQGECAAVILAHIAARGAAHQLNAEDYAARDDADLTRLDLDHAEFSAETHLALL